MNLLIRDEIDSGGNNRMPLRMGIGVAILCFCVIAVIDVHTIFRSSNSTAAIGLLFVPVVATVLAVPGFLAGWCLGHCLLWRQWKAKGRRALAIAAGIVPIALGGWVAKIWSDGHSLTQQVHQVQRMDASELESVLNRPALAGNKFILGVIAQNPNATTETLHRIAILDRPELHEPMGSHFDVMGKNTKGLAVMRLVARHPNTAARDLERLATSTNEYVLADVALSPKVSEATLRKLASRGGYLIAWALAQNPKAKGISVEVGREHK